MRHKGQVMINLLLAIVMMLAVCTPNTEAALRDFGPLNFGGFPTWYRDNNGTAVQQCLSNAVSPVPGISFGLPICNILPDPLSNPPFDPTKPITFFPNPPTGWNYPPESFYYSLAPDKTAFTFAAGKGRIVIVLALEAAFAVGDPLPGDQTVFSRVRVFLTQGVPDGNYKITHPYGVENLTVTGGLLRYTRDIGAVGVPFVAALPGDIGPFFRWTVDPALPAGVQNPDGTLNGLDPVTRLPNGDVFLGDFNVGHTFTGSPFGTNYFRCDGPVGSGIGGPGIDFIETNLGNLEGWKYTTPIPSPLTADRVTYRRDVSAGQIDIFASSSAASNTGAPAALTVSGTNIPTTVMTGDGTGKFFSHLTGVNPATIPSTLTITNTADNPPTAVVANVVDEVGIVTANYEPNSKSLTVSAFSNDLILLPALTLDGFGPIPPAGTLTIGPLDVPPPKVTVLSAARGTATLPITVRAFTPPVAADDTAGVATGASVAINVLANDTVTAPATIDPTTVVILTNPVNGTVSVDPITGIATYTANVGPALSDSFTYTVRDTNLSVSNVATVRIAISLSDVKPVANNDTASAIAGVTKNIAVLANDTSATSTLNPASIVVSNVTTPAAAPAPTITLLGNGTIDFTATATGVYTFQYVVTDSFTGAGGPLTSDPATVTVTVVPPNQLPVAVSDSAAVTTGSSVTFSVVANDTDADGTINAASVVIASPPTNGTVTVNANGTVTYTPAAGFVGTATFTYNVKDNTGATSNNALVTVNVTAPLNETITVTRAQYTLSSRQWRVDGTTTARVNGETMDIFNSTDAPLSGTVGRLATVNVAANGSWTWTSPTTPVPPAPTGARRISIRSSLGKILNSITVTIR